MGRPSKSLVDAQLLQALPKYLSSITRGDSETAARTIRELVERKVEVPSIYLEVICPAQRALGALWTEGKISITEEHVATQISLQQLAYLRQQQRPKKPLGKRALVSVPSTEPHLLAAQVVADFLYFEGWEVFFPGNSTPERDLAQFIKDNQIALLCLSVSLPPPSGLQETIRKIKSSCPEIKVVVGGAASAPLRSWEYVDAVIDSVMDLPRAAREFLGANGEAAALEQYLQQLGERIVASRKARSLSQSQLASTAGLDRAYLSAVENGKQNISIGAVHKLAVALGVDLSELL